MLLRTRWGNSKKLWKNTKLKEDFASLVGPKCWYSEALSTGAYFDIDHFRPKGSVKELVGYDYNKHLSSGYNWLKNDPQNYRLACEKCNRGGGKVDYFPLMSNVYLTENGNEVEKPALLDPCDKSDVQLLTFFADKVLPLDPNCDTNLKRVSASKVVYNLMDLTIKNARNKVWQSVDKYIAQYDRNKDIESLKENLTELVDRKSQFSACAIAAVNSLLAGRDGLLEELELDLEL